MLISKSDDDENNRTSEICECLDFEIEEIEIPYDVPVVEEMDII